MIENLEKEFLGRKFQHKYSLVGAALVLDYVKEKKEALVPCSALEDEALAFAHNKIEEYMEKGTFDQEYEKAYNKLGALLP